VISRWRLSRPASVIDEHTGECLGGLVERSVTAEDPITELNRLAA
jgi:putative transposase